MTKQIYWIGNPAGGPKALVEGAEERDRWTARGWAETSEPGDSDLVWVHNANTDGRTFLPFNVVGDGSYWQGAGFTPSAPAEPVDTTKDPVLRDQLAPETKAAEAAKVSTTSTPAATGGTTKEK